MAFDNAKNTIKNNFILWNAIKAINNEYVTIHFELIKADPIFYEKNTSKKKYGRSLLGGALVYGGSFDFKAFLSGKIFEEMEKYQGIISRYLENYNIYKEYEKKVLEIFDKKRLYKDISTAPKDDRNWFSKNLLTSTKDRFSELQKYEYDYLNSITYSPVFPYVDLHLKASSQYDSYERHVKYGFQDIVECYKMALEKKGKMSFVQQQRSILSDDMRYNILKRDGFRCCICGAKASDGVRLEVDHIIPVSKGGKTIDSNLQTLCERCNRGKRDKA